jgi:hypothetical protein
MGGMNTTVGVVAILPDCAEALAFCAELKTKEVSHAEALRRRENKEILTTENTEYTD